jgi:hypothetical protein
VAECHGHASLEPHDCLANIGLFCCVICKQLCCEFCVVDKHQKNKGKPKCNRPNPNWHRLKCRGGYVPIELESMKEMRETIRDKESHLVG